MTLGLAVVLGAAAGSGGTVLVMSKLVGSNRLQAAAPATAIPTVSPVALSPVPVASSKAKSLSGPGDRSNAAGAFDQARGKLVLFGGMDATNTFLNETWTWDGHAWNLEHPSSSPPARAHAALAYDAARRVVVLHGGGAEGGATQWFNDTWTWDGAQWMQMGPRATPPYAGGFQVMSYDSARRAVLLFDWTGPWPAAELNEVWSWDGTDWTKLATTGAAPTGHTSSASAMAYLAAIKSTVFQPGGRR